MKTPARGSEKVDKKLLSQVLFSARLINDDKVGGLTRSSAIISSEFIGIRGVKVIAKVSRLNEGIMQSECVEAVGWWLGVVEHGGSLAGSALVEVYYFKASLIQ